MHFFIPPHLGHLSKEAVEKDTTTKQTSLLLPIHNSSRKVVPSNLRIYLLRQELDAAVSLLVQNSHQFMNFIAPISKLLRASKSGKQ